MSAPLPAAPPVPVEYPGSDGKPMGETLTHGRCIHDVLYFLHGFFAARADVLVAGDNFIYYEEGNPRASVVPDVFVVFGAVKNEYREGGLAGRVQAVGGAEGTGLRAGGDLSEHAAGGLGAEAVVVREVGGGGVLSVRPEG